MSAPPIAVLGDGSSHGGTLVSTNQDGTVMLKGLVICVNGCEHSCPIPGHGTTAVTAIATVTHVQGKLVITYGATAGCGAVIEPPDRTVYAS
jgi:uncharacterized Zn-binding protein involved in type VI secretion